MKSTRVKKINSELQKHIFNGIMRECSIQSAIVSVARVDATDDLALAKVYLSIFCINTQVDKKAVFDAVVKASPEIRNYIAHSMKMRYVPNLKFYLDEGQDANAKIENALKTIKK